MLFGLAQNSSICQISVNDNITLKRKLFCKKLSHFSLGTKKIEVFLTFPTFKSFRDDLAPVKRMVGLCIPEI